jgi:hypothetical protein
MKPVPDMFYLSASKLHQNQKAKNKNVILSVGSVHHVKQCMNSLCPTFDATQRGILALQKGFTR